MPRLDISATPEAERRCEVFVIGCGPAGSTVGALLAQKGRDVAVVDKDRHPRFHIGESLLPLNMPILQRLGVWDELREIGIQKNAAEFESRAHNKTVCFAFSEAFDKRWPYAFQVRRSEFDHMLLRNCAAKGARVFEGARVTSVEFGNLVRNQDTVVNLRLENGTTQAWRTRFLVDASGRDTFLADRFGIKRKNRKHASAAIFGHFRNARRNSGAAEGHITIVWFAHGWFWFIPLKDGTTSVGAVCWPSYMKTRSTDPTTFLLQTIALAPEIAARLTGAELTAPATATGNYSYQSDHMAGDGYLMVGDAWAFVDPVFSSGVLLAMNSATLGADVVEAVLQDPAQAPRLYPGFERTVRRGVKTFSWLIYRMTSPVIRKLFMAPRNVFGVQSAVISLLAGDVFRFGPARPRLYLFRVIYYLNCLATLPTSLGAWRKRRHDIRAAGEGVKISTREAHALPQSAPPATRVPNSMNGIVALIPAYNEAATIRDLVERVSKIVPEVVVVDDGSSDATAEELIGLPVTLLRNERNLGKAASLWKGFEFALSRGAQRIVTLDGDGQHRPEDIARLLSAAQRFPGNIVIGARLHDKKNFPARRYYANQFARFGISWAAGYPIADTQSGFRVYPAALLTCLRRRDVPWNGFVFESEILIAAANRGVRSVAVAIPSIYPKQARPSHYRPVYDSARIVVMATGRLLRRGMYPLGLWRSLDPPMPIEVSTDMTSLSGLSNSDVTGKRPASLPPSAGD